METNAVLHGRGSRWNNCQEPGLNALERMHRKDSLLREQNLRQRKMLGIITLIRPSEEPDRSVEVFFFVSEYDCG
jgi:hypothetical protein